MESEGAKSDVISSPHKHTEKHAEHVKRKSNSGDHDHHQHNDSEAHHGEHVKNGKHENKDEQPDVKKPRLSGEAAAAHAQHEAPKESGDEVKETKNNDTEKKESEEEVEQGKDKSSAATEGDKHGSSDHTKATEESKHKACAGDTAKDAAKSAKSS